MRTAPLRRSAAWLALPLSLAGCGGDASGAGRDGTSTDTTTAGAPPTRSASILPADTAVFVGQTVTYRLVAFGSDGSAVSPNQAGFRSEQPAIAGFVAGSPAASGTVANVTAHAPGIATIVGNADGILARGTLRVLPRP